MYIVTYQTECEDGFYYVEDENGIRKNIERLIESFQGFVDIEVSEIVKNKELDNKVFAMVEETRNKKQKRLQR